jgi:hypothetical protein
MFKKYDNTTQIVSLPGGVKRHDVDIRDDTRSLHPPRINTQSYSTKILRDYKSNISCLPGSQLNVANTERPLVRQQKNQSSDIFNINNNNSNTNIQNYNSFKISNKKVENTNRIFGQSHNEKSLVSNPKAHRPNQIRNVFESQISII